MKTNRKIKIIGGLLVLAAVILLYPGVLFYLERTYGDLGSLNVLETYVPWIFHMLLLLIVAVVGVAAVGLWILLCMEPEESPTEENPPGTARKEDPEVSVRKEPELHQMEAPEEVEAEVTEPQVVSVNVAEKAGDEAPESWQNNEEWED